MCVMLVCLLTSLTPIRSYTFPLFVLPPFALQVSIWRLPPASFTCVAFVRSNGRMQLCRLPVDSFSRNHTMLGEIVMILFQPPPRRPTSSNPHDQDEETQDQQDKTVSCNPFFAPFLRRPAAAPFRAPVSFCFPLVSSFGALTCSDAAPPPTWLSLHWFRPGGDGAADPSLAPVAMRR